MRWLDRLIANIVLKEVWRRMPGWLKRWVQRLIPENLAGIVGVGQGVLTALREVVIAVIRLLDAIPFVHVARPDKLIKFVERLDDRLHAVLGMLKGWLLKLGKK